MDEEARFQSSGEVLLLRGVDLAIPQGRSVAVMGTSGSGKSVLLTVIIGLLPADAGSVRIEAVRGAKGWRIASLRLASDTTRLDVIRFELDGAPR